MLDVIKKNSKNCSVASTYDLFIVFFCPTSIPRCCKSLPRIKRPFQVLMLNEGLLKTPPTQRVEVFFLVAVRCGTFSIFLQLLLKHCEFLVITDYLMRGPCLITALPLRPRILGLHLISWDSNDKVYGGHVGVHNKRI